MTTKEKIEIMQAYEDGKEIEYRCKKGRIWIWSPQAIPKWNWDEYDYRIKSETKPEPEYVPYDSVTEVEKDKWVVKCDTGEMHRIAALDKRDSTVLLNGNGRENMDDFFKNFMYEDGTRCGKKVEA